MLDFGMIETIQIRTVMAIADTTIKPGEFVKCIKEREGPSVLDGTGYGITTWRDDPLCIGIADPFEAQEIELGSKFRIFLFP